MATTRLVHDEIRRFLRSPEPEVLCVTGKWGIGKTYTWKQYVLEAQAEDAVGLGKYAYVSLFGQNSLGDLKYAMFEETVDVGQIGKGADFASVSAGYKSVKNFMRRRLGDFGGLIPIAKDYIGGAGRALFLAVRNQIVCIDDLERAGDGIKAIDVLGLVSFLKEERGCKVVLLLNQDELGQENRQAFDLQLEKVVDARIEFKPTPEEAARMGLDEKSELYAVLAGNIIALGITNLRVIKKIDRLYRSLVPLLREFDPDVLKQAMHTATLFGWIVYQPKDAPPLEFVTGFNPWKHRLSKQDEATDEEKAWRALLQNYQFTSADEFDGLILDGIRLGYFDPAPLKLAATALNAQIAHQKQDGSFGEAWQLYHDSFRTDANEVLDKMAKAFRSSVKVISPINLSGTITLFKELGRAKQAGDLLTFYMEQRGGEARNFYDLSRSPFGADVRDPDVRKAFAEKLITFKDERDPAAILVSIAKKSGWNPEDIELLAKVTPEQFEKLFKDNAGAHLSAMVQAALQFGTFGDASKEMRQITASATEALRRIGSESEINARRVGRYGIAVEQPNAKEGN